MPIGNGVTLRGFYDRTWNLTWVLAAGITRADIGKAMAQDPSAPNQAKLAGDNEDIIGFLESYENRVQENIVVGAICHKFSESLPYVGTVPAIGDQVCGSATPGSVKTATAALAAGRTRTPARVVEQNVADGTVVVLMQ